MLGAVESPPSAPHRVGPRAGAQEKRLRKRRDLDALSARHRRCGSSSAAQELLGVTPGSSSEWSAGEGAVGRAGTAVWRGHSLLTLWWGLKWGLGASTVFLLASITIWLNVSTRFELDVVRRHVVRGELTYIVWAKFMQHLGDTL
jgi:hypothetical protein